MSKVEKEILQANKEYVEQFGGNGDLPMPPGRKFAILTCMDARLMPSKFAGLSEGDAHVIRNAGGRASDDAIRSLVISYKLLGTKECFVIHHTDCGMMTFDDAVMDKLLRQENKTVEGTYIKWLTFKNLEQSVKDDIERLKQNPMIKENINLHGYIYDCETGTLIKVKL